ncbi:hypothetical protein FCULG_00011729 [Fusarium culmorum]|uniref:Uncharacterized protein n=1 Tax=Fusarium culmorum TaxID=5516 RepID=A0A2T4GRQ4_FUSCU|nr:hypothetical protein FCULG_00011729 [Fusarium culmorum]
MSDRSPNEEIAGVDTPGVRTPRALSQNLDVDTITQQLSACLQTPQGNPPFIAPVGFDEALSATDHSEPISKAFKQRGFWPWLAYFLVTKNGDKLSYFFECLSALPLDIVSDIAGRVASVPVEPTLVMRLQNTLWTARRGSQRRSQLQQLGIHDFPPAPTSSPLPEPSPRKRPRVQPLHNYDNTTSVIDRRNFHSIVSDIPQTGDANTPYYPARDKPVEWPRIVENTNPWTPDPDSLHNYAYPNASKIPLVFSPELGDMIVRNENFTASIFASFPSNPDRCRLVLDIEAGMVAPLAMKLYDAQVVETGRQRAFRLPSGAILEIMSAVRLTNTKLSRWEELLGSLIGGVRNAQEYVNEVGHGLAMTKCLAMEVPGATNSPARISLVMDPMVLDDVIKKLWPPEKSY